MGLVEDAAVVEVRFLRFLPAAEDVVDVKDPVLRIDDAYFCATVSLPGTIEVFWAPISALRACRGFEGTPAPRRECRAYRQILIHYRESAVSSQDADRGVMSSKPLCPVL